MTETAKPLLPTRVRVAAGHLLETLLNQALKLDAATAERIAALDGRSVEVHLRGPELKFRVAVADDRLHVGPPNHEASLRVAATPGALLGMALQHGHDTAPGGVEIAGDAQLARQVERLVAGFEPDFEAAFATHLGDVVGVPLARGLERALSGLSRQARHATRDAAAWLRDEIDATPPKHAVDDFLDGVDDLEQRLDRLEARLTRLEPPQ